MVERNHYLKMSAASIFRKQGTLFSDCYKTLDSRRHIKGCEILQITYLPSRSTTYLVLTNLKQRKETPKERDILEDLDVDEDWP
jgi:hypothetical protein